MGCCAESRQEGVFAIEYRFCAIFEEDKTTRCDHQSRTRSHVPFVLGDQRPRCLVLAASDNAQFVGDTAAGHHFKCGILESFPFTALDLASRCQDTSSCDGHVLGHGDRLAVICDSGFDAAENDLIRGRVGNPARDRLAVFDESD